MKLHKIYSTKINSKEEMKQAIKDFSGNFCKGTSLLKNDKELASMAIKDCPQNYRFIGKNLKTDETLQSLASKNAYTRETLVFPTEESLTLLMRRNIDYYKELNSGTPIADLEAEYDKLYKNKQLER